MNQAERIDPLQGECCKHCGGMLICQDGHHPDETWRRRGDCRRATVMAHLKTLQPGVRRHQQKDED